MRKITRSIIGLSAYYVKSYEFDSNRIRGMLDQDMMMSTMDYSEAVVESGGVPVVIAPIDSDSYLRSVIDNIDGLLLTGGGDINPQVYNQPFRKGIGKLEVQRDSIELKLIKFALEKRIPILGICRGFQLLNIYYGGTIIQDINNNFDTDIEHVGNKGFKSSIAHEVSFVKECNLKNCFGSKNVHVNSFHHQVIDKLGNGLSVCAMSEDGFIEAFEHSINSEVFGVQWHPEMMAKTDKRQLEIFKMFVKYVKGF